MRRVVEYLRKHPGSTKKEIRDALGMSMSGVFSALKQAVEHGYAIRDESGREYRWTATAKSLPEKKTRRTARPKQLVAAEPRTVPKKKAKASGRGVVYILSNPAMPDLVKIGYSETVKKAKERKRLLYRSGVPFPFECEFAMQVDDARERESKLHRLFDGARRNKGREFFEVDPEELIEVLIRCGYGKDVTRTLNMPIKGVAQADVEAGKNLAKKRPKMRLSDLGIPDGAVLVSRKAGTEPEKCKVVDANKNKVRFRGKVRPFTEATFIILGEPKWAVTSPAYCTRYWEYRGKWLRELYEEIFS